MRVLNYVKLSLDQATNLIIEMSW